MPLKTVCFIQSILIHSLPNMCHQMDSVCYVSCTEARAINNTAILLHYCC